MTIEQIYRFGIEELRAAGIEDAEIDAFLLLEHITGLTKARYYIELKKEVQPGQETEYQELIARRKTRIPLQHLTKVQEFMGLPFMVNEHVLIPRQDTETLVETVLERLSDGDTILDMCTGSGCILLSLLVHGSRKRKLNPAESLGADISLEALSVAKENASQLNVEVPLLQSDLFAEVTGTFSVIVSNPPYIKTGVIEELQDEVRLHDPITALDGMEDGLHFYRRIIDESPAYLKAGGRLYFEIGYDQGEDVMHLMETKGFEEITLKKDLTGLDRIVSGVYNKSEK